MANFLLGTTKNDVLMGTSAEDLIYGLPGSDSIDAGDGDDDVSGGGEPSDFDNSAVTVKYAADATFTLQTPSKGAINPVGMYKIAADGSIKDVTILWSGGAPQGKGSGNAPQDLNTHHLDAGERYGFFILSNGYGTRGNAKLLGETAGKFELRDENGGAGDTNDKSLRLWYTDAAGKSVAISTAAGHKVYNFIGSGDDATKLNSDGHEHGKATVDNVKGTLTIGLESSATDTPDFTDAIISIDFGSDNALALSAKHAPSTASSGKGNNDWLDGGNGNDKVMGLSGDDTVVGGKGNDILYGNTGNDTIIGGDDNDQLRGGKDNDALSDGAGNDKAFGNTGNDTVYAGEGDDDYQGGSGVDTLDFSLASKAVKIEFEAHTATGAGTDKFNGFEHYIGSTFNDTIIGNKDNSVIGGGDGNDLISGKRGSDTLTGGDGNDTFFYQSRKDAAGENYTDKFVDVITDFGKGDKLDFTGMKLDIKKGIADAISIVDDADGSHVLAKFGSLGFHEIMVLENVHGIDAASLYADGSLLV